MIAAGTGRAGIRGAVRTVACIDATKSRAVVLRPDRTEAIRVIAAGTRRTGIIAEAVGAVPGICPTQNDLAGIPVSQITDLVYRSTIHMAARAERAAGEIAIGIAVPASEEMIGADILRSIDTREVAAARSTIRAVCTVGEVTRPDATCGFAGGLGSIHVASAIDAAGAATRPPGSGPGRAREDEGYQRPGDNSP